jgi:hypothetical protein
MVRLGKADLGVQRSHGPDQTSEEHLHLLLAQLHVIGLAWNHHLRLATHTRQATVKHCPSM